MAEPLRDRAWLFWGLYVLLFAAILFVQLLPLETQPRRWAMPDWLLGLTMVWALRRPEAVPLILVAVCVLIEDFLLQRPPGLWAALLVVASEVMRSRSDGMKDGDFFIEWLNAALAMIFVVLGYRLILLIFVVEMPPLAPTLIQLGLTILVYPAIVFASWAMLGVRKTAVGETDALGRPV